MIAWPQAEHEPSMVQPSGAPSSRNSLSLSQNSQGFCSSARRGQGLRAGGVSVLPDGQRQELLDAALND